MSHRHLVAVSVVVGVLWFSSGTARAAWSCSVDPQYVVMIGVSGGETVIEADWNGIYVNGTWCADEQLVESIVVAGGPLADRVTLTGSFAPGLTAESDYDEIEVTVSLGAATDTLTFDLSDGFDHIQGGTDGLGFVRVVMNPDSDVDDFTLNTDIENLKIFGNRGDDVFNFSSWQASRLWIYGGDGNDTIQGSSYLADRLYGEAGDDLVLGLLGNDVLDGGPGADTVLGEGGNDTIEQGALADGADDLQGGDGIDTLDYGDRTAAITVALDGTCASGEAGEADCAASDIEKVIGGAGNDVITGTTAANTLTGGLGSDSLFGGGGVDTLYGGSGDDHLVGDAGADKLYGDVGNDTLEGGSGNDTMRGGNGADVLDGSVGTDAYFGEAGNDFFYNNDGVAETVDCGDGAADDPELDTGATDTFIACELI